MVILLTVVLVVNTEPLQRCFETQYNCYMVIGTHCSRLFVVMMVVIKDMISDNGCCYQGHDRE